jgi:coenzyme F420-reducing hydrogenase gamma subunit
MSVCCECCVLSGRGLCDGLTTRLEESYRLWCGAVCDNRNLVYKEPNINEL